MIEETLLLHPIKYINEPARFGRVAIAKKEILGLVQTLIGREQLPISRKIKNSAYFFIVFFLFSKGYTQNKERILMVGNSFTFYNLPMTIEQFVNEN